MSEKPLTEEQIQKTFTLNTLSFGAIMRDMLYCLIHRHRAEGVPEMDLFNKAQAEQVKLRKRAEFLYKLMSKPRDPEALPITRYGLVLLRLVHEGMDVERILLVGKTQISKQLETLDGWIEAYQLELDELGKKYRAEHAERN